MKTDKELKEIALGINSGTIISSMTVRNEEMSLVFMPLSLMDAKQYKEFIDKKPGMIFEYIDQALPRSANDLPIFTSMKILDLDEYHKLIEIINELKKWISNEKAV